MPGRASGGHPLGCRAESGKLVFRHRTRLGGQPRASCPDLTRVRAAESGDDQTGVGNGGGMKSPDHGRAASGGENVVTSRRDRLRTRAGGQESAGVPGLGTAPC